TREVVLSLAKTNHLAIVTNKDRACVVKILQYHNLPEDLFDIIICCDDVSNRKPHPEALITCMDKMYWQKLDCLYIGDNSNDLRFAANAGIDAVIVTRSQCKSEYEIETLNALLD
ncbi:MAG: HAD family hydrolase, partial [Bacilli bacterium]|nr:HAD family hydrolase [Bacilli bacterium]